MLVLADIFSRKKNLLILCLSDTIGRITCAVFLEIQFMAFWGFLRLSMTKHSHTWIDQSFVLADLSIFYERSL